MAYNVSMGKGKQIGLRLELDEVERLEAVYKRISRYSDTTISNIIREFLSLRPRKVTTQADFDYFSGKTDVLPESDNHGPFSPDDSRLRVVNGPPEKPKRSAKR